MYIIKQYGDKANLSHTTSLITLTYLIVKISIKDNICNVFCIIICGTQTLTRIKYQNIFLYFW